MEEEGGPGEPGKPGKPGKPGRDSKTPMGCDVRWMRLRGRKDASYRCRGWHKLNVENIVLCFEGSWVTNESPGQRAAFERGLGGWELAEGDWGCQTNNCRLPKVTAVVLYCATVLPYCHTSTVPPSTRLSHPVFPSAALCPSPSPSPSLSPFSSARHHRSKQRGMAGEGEGGEGGPAAAEDKESDKDRNNDSSRVEEGDARRPSQRGDEGDEHQLQTVPREEGEEGRSSRGRTVTGSSNRNGDGDGSDNDNNDDNDVQRRSRASSSSHTQPAYRPHRRRRDQVSVGSRVSRTVVVRPRELVEPEPEPAPSRSSSAIHHPSSSLELTCSCTPSTRPTHHSLRSA